MTLFDEKFGADFLPTVPLDPGVYRFYDRTGNVIYVGKAKRLRRRLAQYRLVTAQRKHRRMRAILQRARQVDFTVCASHLDACLLEIQLIQDLRPRCNIAGAYSFLYPYIGMRREGGVLGFAFSTKLEHLESYEVFGAFRSRETAGAAFFSLMKLLTYVGHRAPMKRPDGVPERKGSFFFSFHRLSPSWDDAWRSFFEGKSREALEMLVLSLLENIGARTRPAEFQEKINSLRVFWEEESLALAKAMERANYEGPYPVLQTERDPLFLRARLFD